MEYKIRLKRGTSTQWQSANPLLDAGEMGLETNTGKIKIGDGSTYWNDLAYGPAISVSDLTDAQISSLANGQTLKYDSSQQKWLNHTLIKSDLGLTNVDNTADIDKPISNATQTALDLKANSADVYTKSHVDTSLAQKVQSNSAITGSTATKITYDSKGLVTAGTQAAMTDLADTNIVNPLLNQILTYNGSSWTNGNNAVVNPGPSVTFYLTRSTSGVAGYEIISKTPDSAAEIDEATALTANTPTLMGAYVSDSVINKTVIDAGIWEFNIWTYVNSQDFAISVNVYKRDVGGTETLLFTGSGATVNWTTVQAADITSVQQSFSCNATDKLVIKVYGLTTKNNLTAHLVHSGSAHYSHFHTPLSIGHNDIAGLQGGASNQYYHLTSSEYVGTGTGVFVRESGATLVSPAITTPTGIVKGDVGLSNVDNTSDMNKPVSTHQEQYIKQTAYYYAIVL